MQIICEQSKACKACRVEMSISEFRMITPKVGNPYFRGVCNDCRRKKETEYARTYRSRHPHKIRENQMRISERYRTDETYREHVKSLNRAKIARNPESQRDKRLRYQKKNPSKYTDHNRNQSMRRLYGITIIDYQRMKDEQGGKCLICRLEFESQFKTHIDHCHETGLVRGLLCHACNSGLGMFKDDPSRMRAAADYIEFFRKNLANEQ